MATIKDVAKKAGVSVSTVSLVLNGKRNISKEKYDLILSAIKELNYRPSVIAQNLKKQKFHFIGVVLPSTEGHYSQIIKGIHDVLSAEKYHIIVSITNDDVQKEESVFEELISAGVSGIIAVPCDTENTDRYKKWIEASFAIVFLERKIENVHFSNVLFDNQKIIYNKTKELLTQLTPRDIALITGPQKFSNEKECATGFRDAILEAGPASDQKDIEILETSFQRNRATYDLLKRYGQGECEPKCFLVSNMENAEMLAELQYIMKYQPRIYALSGDVWQEVKKSSRSIVQHLPREAMKMGQKAAGLLMSFVQNRRISEKRDILIETHYDYKEPVAIKPLPALKGAPLRILLLQSNAMDVLYKMSPNFNKETGIKTEFTFVPFYELIHALAGNKALDYDVLWVDIPLINTMANMGKLLDLRPFIDKDERHILSRFPEGVLKCVLNGKKQVFGLPLLMDEGLLYYRRDIFADPKMQWAFFKKYGVELSPPISWTEFNYIAEFFNPAYNPDSPFKYGTVLSLTGPTAAMEEFYVRQWAFNGSMVDKWGKLNIHSIENIRALESLITAYRHSPPESLDYFFEESFACLLKGEAPMVQGFPTHYLPFRHSEHSETFEAQISVAPIPGGKPMLGGWIIGANAASKMPEQAYEFICWITREDLNTLRGILGHILPIKKTYNNTVLNNCYPGLKMMKIENYSKELREVIYDNSGTPVDQFSFENIMATELIKALKGEQSAVDALKNAQDAVEAQLRGVVQ